MNNHAQQVVEKLSKNGLAASLAIIFEDLPDELSGLLDEAQTRYMHLIGIIKGEFDDKEIDDDRLKYSEFYDRSTKGEHPLFIDEDCIVYMSAHYGLPKLLCKMQIINDFNWTAASGFVEDPETVIGESVDDLKTHLEDDKLLLEAVEFILNRANN